MGKVPTQNLRPFGNQPLRAGQFRGMGRQCGNKTTIINNNVFGGGYNTNMYASTGQCGGGSNKFLDGMMAFGIGATILGGIMNMFGFGKNNNEQIQDDQGYDNSPKEAPENKELAELNKKLEAQRKEIEELKNQSKAFEASKANKTEETPADLVKDKYKFDKEEVPGADKDFKSYTVTGGDSWYYVVSEKYGITNHNEIMAVVKELQSQAANRGEDMGVGANKFYKAGDTMQLPENLTVTINGQQKSFGLGDNYSDTPINEKVATNGTTAALNSVSVTKEQVGSTWNVIQDKNGQKTILQTGLSTDAADKLIKTKEAELN